MVFEIGALNTLIHNILVVIEHHSRRVSRFKINARRSTPLFSTQDYIKLVIAKNANNIGIKYTHTVVYVYVEHRYR